jgi:hypothetical protein
MQYRLVPVGDKIVVIVDSEPQHPMESAPAEWTEVLEAKAGHYDFSKTMVKGNGQFSQPPALIRGYSHE